MQDSYAGDVGDFGKFGLLRILAAGGFKIGVNWYRTVDSPSNRIGDGRLIHYLKKDWPKKCDPCLTNSLLEIVESGRSIQALEERHLIENATYFSQPLCPASCLEFSRSEWHRNAMRTLESTDIVFCDPDNGLIVPSAVSASKKSDKYIFHYEIAEYYSSGKSVIFYNHRCRQKESAYLQRFQSLKNNSAFQMAAWFGISYRRGTVRDYIFILQPTHADAVQKLLTKFYAGEWSKHFTKLDI